MNLFDKIKPFIITSLAPLAFTGTLSLITTILNRFLLPENEISLPHHLTNLTLQVYTNYPQFLFMMFFINIVTKANKKISLKAYQVEPKNILKTLVLFSIIFCCYQAPIRLSLSTIQEAQYSPLPRRLEEHNHQVPLSNPSCPQLSLSVGREMSSITTTPTAMISSKNGRILYTLEAANQVLKILDISNIKAPRTISILSLYSGFPLRYYSTLYLSDNEEILFYSNFHYLQIVNVSNPKSPFKLAGREDPRAIEEVYFRPAPLLYKLNIDISQDKKTLFVAGIGLEVWNITNISNPILLENSMKDDDLPSTSLALIDKNLVFVDETLQIYDISNPKNRSRITEFETVNTATSMILTNDKKIAYILCYKIFTDLNLEKIDLSNPTAPKRIKTYNLGFQSKASPVIVAISPCNRYIFISRLTSFQVETELRVFDTIEEKVLYYNNSLIKAALTLTFIPNTNYLATSSKTQDQEQNTRFFELFPNFLDRKVFQFSEGTIEKFPIKEVANSFQFSADHQIMFVSTGNIFYDSSSSLEILNVSNFSSMKTLGSYSHKNLSEKILSAFVSEDHTKAVLYVTGGIRTLDISSPSSPIALGYQNHSDSLQDLVVFKDADIIITLCTKSIFEQDGKGGARTKNYANIRIFNASLPTNITQITSLTEQTSSTYFCFILSKNEKILYLAHSQLVVYDLTDISDPKKLATISYNDGNSIEYVYTCLISPDETILAVRIIDGNYLAKFKFFNISNASQPVYVSEIIVPPRLRGYFGMKDSAFSLDSTFIYTVQQENLLIIDVSQIENPKIFGILPNLAINNTNPAASIQMDPDGKTINLMDYQGTFYRMSTQPPETLFIKQEGFRLGEKYSDTLSILKQNQAKEYDLLNPDQYRLIKSHLLSFKIAKGQLSANLTKYSLPSWMNIDTENNLLAIEPKSLNDLGSYTVCSSLSFKLPRNAFTALESLLPNSTDPQELIASLIGMGYLDNQLFITSNFGLLDDFFLPRIYRDFEKSIYQIIKSFHREICTRLEILPSLELVSGDKLTIKTPSPSPMKITIQLESHGRFLSKSYGLLQPVIGKDSSSITIEGSLKEINAALKELVIDLAHNEEICSGYIIIDDRLNPPITKGFSDISSYFTRNSNPVENQNNLLESQINRVSVYTGQYFTININETTFIDKNTDKLSYTVVMNNPERSNLPLWLAFSYPDLKGTPPEEIFLRDYDFLMIVRNEFKSVEVPFTLHAKISPVFAIKLITRYSPYILTLLGFVIYASKIYNILFKRHYKHPKEYLIKHGEEITPNVIFPVMFIAEEITEKKLIWNYFLKIVGTKLNTKSPEKSKILSYFIDQSTGKLNKRKVFEVIQEAINLIPTQEQKQLHLYLSDDEPRKACIFQLFMDELVEWQLNLAEEQYTKKIFNQIQDQCYDFVEFNHSTIFAVNEIALQKFLKNDFSTDSQAKDLKEKLLVDSNKININLLENALISLVFKHQTLDCPPISVKVAIKQRKQMDFVRSFLKQDFKDIHIIDYELNCKIKNSMLIFSGTPIKDFGRKTIVVQISTSSQRILKELWITGIPSRLKSDDSSYQFDLSCPLDKSYDVL